MLGSMPFAKFGNLVLSPYSRFVAEAAAKRWQRQWYRQIQDCCFGCQRVHWRGGDQADGPASNVCCNGFDRRITGRQGESMSDLQLNVLNILPPYSSYQGVCTNPHIYTIYVKRQPFMTLDGCHAALLRCLPSPQNRHRRANPGQNC